jgi:hypothetical protein
MGSIFDKLGNVHDYNSYNKNLFAESRYRIVKCLLTPSFLQHKSLIRRVRKIAKSDYWLCHVCPSVRTEQLGSQWTDFHEILYLSIFSKPVEKIQVSSKSDKNKGYFIEEQYTFFYYTWFVSSYHEKFFRQNGRENKNAQFLFSKFFSRKSCGLWDNVKKYCKNRTGHVTI